MTIKTTEWGLLRETADGALIDPRGIEGQPWERAPFIHFETERRADGCYGRTHYSDTEFARPEWGQPLLSA